MQMTVVLKCECGNSNTYEIKNEQGFEMTGSINDDKYKAEPLPSGVWLHCKKCKHAMRIS